LLFRRARTGHESPQSFNPGTIVNSRLPVLIFDLLRLRAGPQDFPSGWSFAGLMILLYTAGVMFSQSRLGDPDAEIRSLLSMSFQFSAVVALLIFRGFPERATQTLGALACSGLVMVMMSYLVVSQADPNRNQPVLALALLGVFTWSIVIDAHIYRHALSTTMSRGLLIAVLLFAATYTLIELLV
jgi:hypothetical protein